ncbi:MAG: hypothetical protein NZ530_02875 [Thermodesulfobacteriaceae bacterium]|nr:hypothetical protein [Thermodesulfobacteriaceae bacterium]MCX8041409.1 hypothetical protein [Thermodesulfobacteriaceae bacterium]MDW8135827.1 hypothetical protein [Thermodesulfobacterium sp.]
MISYIVWEALVPFIEKGMLIGALSGFLFWLINFKTWQWKNLISFLTLFVSHKEQKRFLGSLSLGLSPGFFLGLTFGVGGLLLGFFGGLMIGLAINSPTPVFIGLGMGTVVGLIVWLTFMFVGGLFAIITAFYNIDQGKEYIFEKRYLFFWWKSRPPLSEVKKALSYFANREVKEILTSLEEIQKGFSSVEKLLSYLESEDWKKRFIACQTLLNLGGETVKHLKKELFNPHLKSILLHLLKNISYETTKSFSQNFEKLVCPKCIVYFGRHKIKIPESREIITFYGCRQCFQSREYIEWPKEVVAVLDQEMVERDLVKKGVWYVNYFKFWHPFDFNSVEIIKASDEEVERFCIQVGNDGDLYRKRRYKSISCVVNRTCNLQAETLNMLRSLFKEVILREI